MHGLVEQHPAQSVSRRRWRRIVCFVRQLLRDEPQPGNCRAQVPGPLEWLGPTAQRQPRDLVREALVVGQHPGAAEVLECLVDRCGRDRAQRKGLAKTIDAIS